MHRGRVGAINRSASGLVLMAAVAAVVASGLPASAGAAVWNPPITVSPVGESTEEPQAAINAQGAVAVVWEDHSSQSRTTIQVSTRPAGGSFTAPLTVSEPSGENASPAVALGPEGQVIVVWQTAADTEYSAREVVMVSTGTIAGGHFSPPEAISGYEGGGGNLHPRAEITNGGEALAFWRGFDERFHYTERPPMGAHFAQPETIGHPGTLVFSPDGTALAVWGEGEEHEAHLRAAVKQPGLPFAPAETIEAAACGELHAAINDAGDAEVDWTTTKECDNGAEPVWLRATYRPGGGHFGAPVDAAEMGGWAQAGGVAVSPKGRVVISARGWITNPASPSYVTALTRLPDGGYGDPEAISNQELLEGPPVLAFDGDGNLYGAAATRDYWGGLESGILANVAPAGGIFSVESQWLQVLREEFEMPPSLVAAGEGLVAAVWLAGTVGDERVELATLASAQGMPPPAPPPVGSVSEGPAELPSAGRTISEGPPPIGSASANQSGGAGSVSGHVDAPRRHLTVTGRARGARSILVLLLQGQRVERSCQAQLSKGSFRAVVSLSGLRPGGYRLEILRRRGRWHRASYRPFDLSAVVADSLH